MLRPNSHPEMSDILVHFIHIKIQTMKEQNSNFTKLTLSIIDVFTHIINTK